MRRWHVGVGHLFACSLDAVGRKDYGQNPSPSGQQQRRLLAPYSPWGIVCVNFPALSDGVLHVKTPS
uniref:Uncharacterized protein n=1 Tax=Oryza punctata TaxID=4537 RepID=A0A0E0LKU9_ORYPU